MKASRLILKFSESETITSLISDISAFLPPMLKPVIVNAISVIT